MINGKMEERLCGNGPNLSIILKEDAYLVKLRRHVIKFFNMNFEAAVSYIQRFLVIRQFFAENEEKSRGSIENEIGKVQIFLKEVSSLIL